MSALESLMATSIAVLLTLSGCADSGAPDGSAGFGGAGGAAGAAGSAGQGGQAGVGGEAGSGGVDPSTPRGSFFAYCRKLADCQPPPIPYLFEPLEPEIFFEQCAASFHTMARTQPCLEALASFWVCVAEELGCDPSVCDVHLPRVDEACGG